MTQASRERNVSTPQPPARAVAAVILDLQQGERRLDNARSEPTALRVVETGGTVLDWLIEALRGAGCRDIAYVGGYHIEKVVQRYPQLAFRFQSEWRSHSELAGLALSPAPDADLIIARASTLCVSEAIERLLAVDGPAAAFYTAGSAPAFAGLIRVPRADAAAYLDRAARYAAGAPDATLAEWVAADGITAVAVDDLAAPIDDPAAVARTVFGGKARTLAQLAPLVRSAVVLPQVRFTADRWRAGRDAVIDRIAQIAPAVVVRSSAHAEDGIETSSAGRFESVLDIDTSDRRAIAAAVDRVFESYATGGRDADARDEVLVQPQAARLRASGVFFTRDLETGAPYFVVNIERGTGRSDVVTSGAGPSETFYIARGVDPAPLDRDVAACVRLGHELMGLAHGDALDVEFGIDAADTMYLFQVRPIASRARRLALADEDLEDELARCRDFLSHHLGPHPILSGRRTIFGSMPDWNPAELIGSAPKPLALTLLQELIGDAAWAKARAEIGYRDVRPHRLIVSLAGKPFVDVRASLNSYLPHDLPEPIAEAWVNHGIDSLERHPELHDKIEFEIGMTCAAFEPREDERRLRDAGLDAAACGVFSASLVRLTGRIIREHRVRIDTYSAGLADLATRRERWLRAGDDAPALARRIDGLLADCERFGTTSFAVLARYAFIAMTLLRSLERRGVLAPGERERLLASIPSVASEFLRDQERWRAGELDAAALMRQYGHLRPSSFDITSVRYGDAWESYGRSHAPAGMEFPDAGAARAILERHAASIATLLGEIGSECTAADVIDFVIAAIPGRERFKFEFMKSVDAVLESATLFGERFGLTREDMAFVPVRTLRHAGANSVSAAIAAELRRTSEFNRKRWALTGAVRLPHLVTRPADVDAFKMAEWMPNFVTSRSVVAEPVLIDGDATGVDLAGRIVLIRAADPGFDWVFGRGIAGLATEFGGAGSHMAIRAAEFGLPAAIGCGELIFERLRHASLIELDCAGKRVRALA